MTYRRHFEILSLTSIVFLYSTCSLDICEASSNDTILDALAKKKMAICLDYMEEHHTLSSFSKKTGYEKLVFCENGMDKIVYDELKKHTTPQCFQHKLPTSQSCNLCKNTISKNEEVIRIAPVPSRIVKNKFKTNNQRVCTHFYKYGKCILCQHKQDAKNSTEDHLTIRYYFGRKKTNHEKLWYLNVCFPCLQKSVENYNVAEKNINVHVSVTNQKTNASSNESFWSSHHCDYEIKLKAQESSTTSILVGTIAFIVCVGVLFLTVKASRSSSKAKTSKEQKKTKN